MTGSCSTTGGLAEAPVSRWGQWMDRMVGADLRSLAATRIAVASIVLLDLLLRARDLTAHYSDRGLLPRNGWFEIYGESWRVSLHLLSGKPAIIAALFGVAALFAVLLLVGYRTRLASVATFVLLASLHSRNPLLLNLGDKLLIILVLWGIFVPWGARLSMDAALDPSSGRHSDRAHRVVSVGTAALVLQMPVVYLFTGLLKRGYEWRLEFSAVSYSLRAEQFVTAFGKLLSQLPLGLLQAVTVGVLLLELIGPVLFFLPRRTALLRTVLILVFTSLQMSFLLMLTVGLFPLVSTAALLPLIPSEVWQRLLRKRAPAQIHYDVDCGFCFKSAAIIATFLGAPRPLPAQNDESIHADLERMQSWVVEYDGRRHFAWDGFVALVRASPLHPMAALLALRPVAAVGNRAYRAVADRRWLGGKMLGWLDGRRVDHRLPKPLAALCVGLMVFGMADNLSGVGVPVRIPERLEWVGAVFHVKQHWRMFAPSPRRDTMWMVPEGHLADGQRMDLLHGVPADDQKPELLSEWFPNARWRKYMVEIGRTERRLHRSYFTDYFCRNWNEAVEEPEQARWVLLYEYRKPSVLVGNGPEATRTLLHRRQCRSADESPLVSSKAAQGTEWDVLDDEAAPQAMVPDGDDA